jgi:hypothetical protein
VESDSSGQPGDAASASCMFLLFHSRLIFDHNRGISGLPIPSKPSSNVDGDVETELDDQPDDTASNSGMFLPLHFRPLFNYNCGTSGLPTTLRPSPDVDGDVEIDLDDQLDDRASDSGMFLPLHPRLIFNYNYGISGLPTLRSGDRLPVPPLGSPSSAGMRPMIPQDDVPLHDQPKTGTSKERWTGGRFALRARKIFKGAARKLFGP